MPGRHAHPGDRRPVDPAERQRAQLRRDVRDARRLPPPRRRRPAPADGDRRAAAGRRFRTRSTTGWSTSSRHRRSTAWGPPAASRSSSRTAATWARRSSRASPTGSSPTRRSRPLARSSQGCSPASGPTRPGSTWTSTATRPSWLGVSIAELFNTLQVYLGSLYVNDFNRFGRTWQVNVQGDANFRKQISDLKQLRSATSSGGMVPLGSIATVRDVSGPVMIIRYNMYPSATINVQPGPGHQLGPGDRRHGEAGPAGAAPGRCARVDRAGAACSSRPATRRCSPSSWPSSWSSWCWRRSTRAGRCRWR